MLARGWRRRMRRGKRSDAKPPCRASSALSGLTVGICRLAPSGIGCRRLPEERSRNMRLRDPEAGAGGAAGAGRRRGCAVARDYAGCLKLRHPALSVSPRIALTCTLRPLRRQRMMNRRRRKWRCLELDMAGKPPAAWGDDPEESCLPALPASCCRAMKPANWRKSCGIVRPGLEAGHRCWKRNDCVFSGCTKPFAASLRRVRRNGTLRVGAPPKSGMPKLRRLIVLYYG